MPTLRPPSIRPRSTAFAAITLAALLAACGPGVTPSPTPSPSPRPTPTPITVPATSAAEAAALVIATNPLFAGAIPLTPDVIGASRWWTATPLAAGGYTIELTVGWGDCPAGCINRRVWTFEVPPDGTVTLVRESGDPLEANLPD